jgi:hypothetical protein
LTLDGATMSVGGTFYGGASSTYAIENGGTLSVEALVDNGSSYDVAGGSTLPVTGNVSDANSGSDYSIDDGKFTVGGTFVSSDDSILASDGSQVQLAALQEDAQGRGVNLGVDATSSIEIGTAGGVAAGTITIDPA